MKPKYKCVIHVHRNKVSYVGRLTVNVYERALLYTLLRCFKKEELFTCRSITLHLELILLQESLVLCLKTFWNDIYTLENTEYCLAKVELCVEKSENVGDTTKKSCDTLIFLRG